MALSKPQRFPCSGRNRIYRSLEVQRGIRSLGDDNLAHGQYHEGPYCILSRALEAHGRPVAFAFPGDPAGSDGDTVTLRAPLLRKSLNYKSLAAGNAYPLFYDTLFASLRSTFTTATENARAAKKGLWKDDLSTTGLAAKTADDLEARGVIFPKLYRRLTSYFDQGGTTLSSFLPWLAKTKEQVLDLSTGNFTHLDNVLVVKGGKISLTLPPEQLVFVSAKTTNTTIAPWRARQIEFVFDPAEVSLALAGLPALAAALGDPYREGRPARNLPRARKSARELYRVLGNTHYAHLVELLATLDACAAAGFTQPTLLRARGRRPFVEAISELHVAEHFLLGDHTISGFDGTKGNESVPDIRVQASGVNAAVEVYCPQAWPGLAAYTDAVRDRVKNLDRAVDFEFLVEHAQLDQLAPDGRLRQLHPGELSEGLDEKTRLEATGSLLAVKKGQAVGLAPRALPVLVVDMSQSELTGELGHTAFYRPAFESALSAKLTDLHGYGLVAFCEAINWGARLIPHFLIVDEALSDQATARQLFR